MTSDAARIVHADAVVTGDALVIRDGAVVVHSRGEILEVAAAADVLPKHQGAKVERVHGALMPGLVNAHVHLELSALRGQVQGGAGFVPWVDHMLSARAELSPEQDVASIEVAVDELVRFGTVAVGEVTNTLAAVQALKARGLVGNVFHEVFGVELGPLEKRVSELPRIIEEQLGSWPGAEFEYAATPHTLYTTHPVVVRRLVRDAAERGGRASLHLAEHPGERRFLEHGDGPVAAWYRSRLKIDPARLEVPKKSPVAFADELGALSSSVLAVHLTDARPDELALVARRGSPVVFCPRSNLFIETKLPPLLAARGAGISPALGTDSLASNTSLDVLAEARALADRFSMVPAVDLVRMATWAGACALGRTDLGRIARGARPGLVAIEGDPGEDACAFILRNLRSPRRWIAKREG